MRYRGFLLMLVLLIPVITVQTGRADDKQSASVRLSQAEYEQLLSHAQQNGVSRTQQNAVGDNGPDGEPMVRLTSREYTSLIEQSKPEAHESWSDKLPPFSKFSFWLGWVSGMVGLILSRLLAVYVFRR